MTRIKLIVGLANPGQQYQDTRHNAGAWLVSELARQQGCSLQAESRFHGDTGRFFMDGQDIRLLIPSTYMNRSGQAIAAMANFLQNCAGRNPDCPRRTRPASGQRPF